MSPGQGPKGKNKKKLSHVDQSASLSRDVNSCPTAAAVNSELHRRDANSWVERRPGSQHCCLMQAEEAGQRHRTGDWQGSSFACRGCPCSGQAPRLYGWHRAQNTHHNNCSQISSLTI